MSPHTLSSRPEQITASSGDLRSGGTCCSAALPSPDVKDAGERVGVDGTKTRTSGGNTLSSRRTAPLKPKPGLNGPPVRLY